jgi:hypothetical protein
MRQNMLACLALGALTAVVVPTVPARAQGTLFCDPDRRCIPTTEQAYNACYQLAMQRGWNMTRTDYRGRNYFIYGCLRGRFR